MSKSLRPSAPGSAWSPSTSRQALFAMAIAACGMTAVPCQAQSVLDQQLGPTAPAAKPADPTPAPKDTTAAADKPDVATLPPTPPVGGSDIVSPDAVKKVDDDDLIRKLTTTGDAPKAPPIKEQIGEMIDRMGASQKRLTDKDTGDVTQETQRRIVADLDVLIELARQQQQQGGQSQQPQQPQDGQKQYSQGEGAQQNPGGSTAATVSTLPRGSSATPNLNPDIHSHGPEEWGGLRPREREMIAHGANEEYLSSYRDMIDRYYQALAELGKSRNH